MFLFAIAMIIGVIFVVFFTIIYGRLFCGWVCPQTIFMEMLFRRLEYWIDGDWNEQKKLAVAPWNRKKIVKRLFKHSLFWIVSFLIANTFLAYIISSESLWEIQTDPLGAHLVGLTAIVIFTTVFYFVFTRLREQVCTTICPYGRLQGVLLDPNSMVVAYDHVRGEQRGKFKKDENRQESKKGDCIACMHCVHVCPTGIDIRNGTQLECINCKACIDECDHIMESVGQEKGLIRFVSENGIKYRTRFQWSIRVKAFSALLVVLTGILTTLLITRNDFETYIMRQRGTTFQISEEGVVSNIYEINMINKTKYNFNVTLKLEDGIGKIETVVKQLKLKKEDQLKERFIIKIPFSEIENGKKILYVKVYGNGKEIDRIKTKFIGPTL
jgi:cytochrome c oxidase accessory protein FixG